ncbi:MAG: MFS transporter [Chloroflexota bacterium]
MPRLTNSGESHLLRGAATRFVVLFGFISLLADMTYEGARSIIGPYLGTLGASAAVVGIVAGLGELVGYGLRIISGYLTDRTRRYWGIAFLGYAVNLVAIPLLAVAGTWPVASTLVVFERMGKAIRTPARDAMLSHATREIGRGRGFGLHEAMDKIGSMTGPLIIAAVLYYFDDLRAGFALLLLPAFLALVVLLISRRLYPDPRDLERTAVSLGRRSLPRGFWGYLAGVGCIAAGYADFALMAFHLQKASVVEVRIIPLCYSLAMGLTAMVTFFLGKWYDHAGASVLVIATIFSSLFAPFVFLGGSALVLVGIALWSVGLGAQGSVMRAAVAHMVPSEKRGSAYGIFNTAFGACWFLGSALMGFLYDISLPALVVFSVLMQLAALPVLLSVRKSLG